MPLLRGIPTPSAYLAARFRARRRLGSLSAQVQKELIRALNLYAANLAVELPKSEKARRRALASRRIIQQLSRDLLRSWERSIREGRAATFEQVVRIWQRAAKAAARTSGVSNATLGAIRLPSLSMFGQFESLGAPQTWRTLLRGHVRRGAAEVQAIFREGLVQGISPQEMSRRLRLYVKGSEPFQSAFSKLTKGPSGREFLDLRKLSKAEKGAAQRMLFNADRIAFTELDSARHEAEVDAFARDPLVHGIRWTLSPNRGTQKGPDECDILAFRNSYGLGKGVFPVRSVPSKPHPLDRCELIPIVVRGKNASKPKPEGDWKASFDMIGISGAGRITEAAAAGAVRRANTVMRRANRARRGR